MSAVASDVKAKHEVTITLQYNKMAAAGATVTAENGKLEFSVDLLDASAVKDRIESLTKVGGTIARRLQNGCACELIIDKLPNNRPKVSSTVNSVDDAKTFLSSNLTATANTPAAAAADNRNSARP